MEAIILNTRRPLFQDRNVRNAIAILFPYEFINNVVNNCLLKQTFGPWDNSELSARKDPSDVANMILSKYQDNISRGALKPVSYTHLTLPTKA